MNELAAATQAYQDTLMAERVATKVANSGLERDANDIVRFVEDAVKRGDSVRYRFWDNWDRLEYWVEVDMGEVSWGSPDVHNRGGYGNVAKFKQFLWAEFNVAKPERRLTWDREA